MARRPSNHGKSWSASDKARLRQLAKGNTPTRVIGLKMNRTESSIRSQAVKQGTSLKPSNQSPYNRRSK